MLLIIFVVIAVLFFKYRSFLKEENEPTYRQQTKPRVSVSFDMPKSTNNYKYPWDETRTSSNTDFSNANFLCYFKKVRPMDNNPDQFGRSVSYSLHIYDPIKRRDDLFRNGFLRIATPEETLNMCKVTELKDILRSNNMSTTGKKADLVSRIATSISLDKLNLPPMCCISEKGQEFINQNHDLIELSCNPYNITYEEYISAKKNSPPYFKYNDIIWAVFNMRSISSGGKFNVNHLNAYHRAIFLQRENKLADSLQQYIYVLYYELNDPSRVIPDFMKEDYKDEEIEPEQIQPNLIKTIFELKDHFSPTMVKNCYSKISVPKTLITNRNFERIINDIFSSKKIDVKNYLPKGLR